MRLRDQRPTREFLVIALGTLVAACGGSADSGRSGTRDPGDTVAAGDGGHGGQPASGARDGGSRGGAPTTGAGGAGGPDASSVLDATEPLVGLSPYDFCVAETKQWCEFATRCCEVPDRASACDAARTTACRPDDPGPSTYDPLRAARCVQEERRAVLDCHYPRSDSPAAATVKKACSGLRVSYAPKLGDYCGESPGVNPCEQLPNQRVFCNTRSDGAGSFRCEAGGPRPHEGDFCSGVFECLDDLACVGGRCAPYVPDGAACDTSITCVSGYCSDGRCAGTGPPVAQESECRDLARD